jgi:hypothetical protein
MHATKSYFGRPLALLMCAAALAASLMVVVLASPARADTLTVTNTRDSGAGTLRRAISIANGEGSVFDTITFSPGGRGTITLASPLTITDTANQGLTIDGGSAADVTISGNDRVQVFEVSSGANLTLANLTVANGNAGDCPSSEDAFGGAISLFKGPRQAWQRCPTQRSPVIPP